MLQYALNRIIYSWPVTSYEHHGVWNHRQLNCLFNNSFRLTSKKTRKRVSGPVTGEFPSQRASNAEGVSMSWCRHKENNSMSVSDNISLQWRYDGHYSVLNHQRLYCLLSRLFRRWSMITSKLGVTGPCVGNSPVTGEFPTQRASNKENVSIW